MISTSEPFAARRVPRLGMAEATKRVRIVHSLDGVESEVQPQLLLTAGGALWLLWRRHSDFRHHDIVLGLDAGGILPAVAVALASGTGYRLAWKLDLDLPHKHMFREPGARRVEVFTYGDLRDQRILVVDDEVTSGTTAANLVGVLRDAGADVVGFACLVEDSAGGGRAVLEDLGVPLCALTVL